MSLKDEGAFECQVNTMPSRSLVVHLQVAFPTSTRRPPSESVLFKVQGSAKEERKVQGNERDKRPRKKEQSSKRREDLKEEAITIVGAPDMQVSYFFSSSSFLYMQVSFLEL